jgi:hypothetical protein
MTEYKRYKITLVINDFSSPSTEIDTILELLRADLNGIADIGKYITEESGSLKLEELS